MKTFLRFILGCLAVVGVIAVGALVWNRLAPNSRIGVTAERAVKRVEEAVMPRGRYLVQLESVNLAEKDWSYLAVFDTPKPIHFSVKQGERETFATSLGSWRGTKTFTHDPVTFYADYDGETPLLMEFREPELVSNGRCYVIQDPWPFAHTALGTASSCHFTWKRVGDLPPSGESPGTGRGVD